MFMSGAIWPIILSGMAGYFVCFWPGRRPQRRILWAVCLPAILGVGLICIRYLSLDKSSGSILESGNTLKQNLVWAMASLWELGLGLRLSVLGILLIAIFALRVGFGHSLLPITLSSDAHSPNEEGHYWKRIQILVWFLVAPCLLIVSLSTFIATYSLRLVMGPFVEHSVFGWFYRSAYIFTMIVAVGIALWITRRDGWVVVRRSLRWPPEKDILLGLFFSAGIGILISIGSYLFDRVQWAAHDFGRYSPPQFGSYFSFPDPWFFLLFIAALSEGIIFRGLLQRIFIQKYGVCRGIVLVGVVWAAFHFFSDSYSGASDFGVLQRLAFRVFMCLALGFVLSWLTLRSGSVLPAAVAHAIYNILVFSDFGPPFPGKATVRAALWAVLAYVLFRYWPVKEEDEPGTVATIVEPGPAT